VVELLRREGKEDSMDAARNQVRSGRFADSFMSATNGGASFEDLLRPQSSVGGPPASRPASSRAPHRPSPLHNVFGPDDRQHIDDTSRVPARSIGLLKITLARGGTRWGTAWLIGPRVLVTAAHNLIHPEDGPASKLDVGLAYDGKNARGDWHSISDNALPKAWEDDPSEDNPMDFAVLRIDDPEVGNKLGWFGFADYEDAKFNNLLVNIFGYPMDVEQKFHMFGAAGRIVNVSHDRLFYDCDAGGGMSGGPIIARFGEQRIAVGIHVAGGAESNVATRLDGAVYEFFRERQSW
jgi:glutamyl endopeptidase